MKTTLLALIIIQLLGITNQATADDKQLTRQERLDSLLAELPKAKGDTNEVNLLTSISFAYYDINPEMGIKYGNQGVEIAKKLKWKEGEAKLFNVIGINHSTKSNYSEALEYYGKALKINEEIGNKERLARNLENMGIIYSAQSDNLKALELYSRALKINQELGNKSKIAGTLGNIGVIYFGQSDYPKALEYYTKALKINEEMGIKSRIASNLGNIGIIYWVQSDLVKALEYYQKALKINKEIKSKNEIAGNLANIGIIYSIQSNYSKALEYFTKALKINKDMGNKIGIATNLGNIGSAYHGQPDYPRALEYYNKALKINKHLGNKLDIARNLGNMGSIYLSLSQDSVEIKKSELNEFISLNKIVNLNKAIEYSIQAIAISEEIGEINDRSDYLISLTEAYKQKGEYKNAFESYKESKKLKDSIFNLDKEKEIANLTAVREKEVAERELVISQLENDQRKQESYVLYGGLALLALVVIIIFRQRRQSEKLLLNILPAKVAKRLKKRKGEIADDIENASTVFIDLVGFTAYSKDKKASDVLKMLNQVFSRIDKLVLKHGLEKIKTIGDGYMAAAGVPEYQKDHSKRAAEFALDVHKELKNFNKESGTNIKARIGIESGSMVAGVIGDMKFIYDLWGDSVNTASRMESTGIPEQVHITENFKLELEKHRNGFAFSEPMEMEIKGKGKMKTYFIESKQAYHSEATA